MIRRLLPEGPVLERREEIEAAYFHPSDRHLRINFVTSLDGAIEVDGTSGPLGGDADRAAFLAMRAVADVVLVGAGTARAEDYGPVRLSAEVQARRRTRGQSPRPPLAVVTATGALDPAARMFEADRQILVFTTEEVAHHRPQLAAVAEVVPCGSAVVDVQQIVAELHRRALGRILCEGGPALGRSLFEAGLVDELCLTLAPALAGEGRHQLSQAWAGAPVALELTSLMEGGGMLLTRYAVAGR